MKYISVREFRSKVSIYMAELPIVLTVHNKPIAVVSKFEKEAKVVSRNDNLVSKVVSNDKKVVSKSDSGIQKVVSNPKVASKVVSKKEAFEKVKEEVEEMREVYAVPKPVGKPKKKKFVPWKQESKLGICQILECTRPAVEEVTIATHEGEDITKKLCGIHAAAAKKERGY